MSARVLDFTRCRRRASSERPHAGLADLQARRLRVTCLLTLHFGPALDQRLEHLRCSRSGISANVAYLRRSRP